MHSGFISAQTIQMSTSIKSREAGIQQPKIKTSKEKIESSNGTYMIRNENPSANPINMPLLLNSNNYQTFTGNTNDQFFNNLNTNNTNCADTQSSDPACPPLNEGGGGGGGPVDCTANPNDPSCNVTPTDCSATPYHPDCTEADPCLTDPSSPSCKLGGGGGAAGSNDEESGGTVVPPPGR